MMKNFNIAEILKSVDTIVSDNKPAMYKSNKIIDRAKKLNNKTVGLDNWVTEKIIVDAEKILDAKNKKVSGIDNGEKIDIKFSKPLILENEETFETDNIKKNTSKNLLEKNENESLASNALEPLVLNKEYTVEKSKDDIKESFLYKDDALDDLVEENDDLIENNHILNSKSLKLEEEIKDLNLVVKQFSENKRYSSLDSKIKLYQADNATLRKKIFDLTKNETKLRLQISEIEMSLNIEKKKDSNIEKPVSIDNASNQELNEKINFFREENAKITIDKSVVQRKLENTKNQLVINENNKKELKKALDNLNSILSASNIESSTFKDKED